MKNIINTLIGLGLFASAMAGAAGVATSSPDQQQIKQGEYLARAGDCFACHSANAAKPFAGGLGMATPIGKIYSSNITPDNNVGIGTWSFDNFNRLMRTGVTKAGYTVYPAMPYPSYSRLSDTDMHALYACFMNGVKADSTPNKKSDIPWPLSMRFPLAIWRWIYAPTPTPYQAPAVAGADAQVLRGAYLVEGLGHCGACHTARGVGLQEKALTSLGNSDYLAGGQVIDGWTVPSLRNEHGGGLARWTKDDIVAFLKSGRTHHTASFGAMNDVVAQSMQYMTQDDLTSISMYLKSLPPHNTAKAYVADPSVATALFNGKPGSAGAQIYLNKCAGCHRSDGAGYGTAFPALAGNAVLQTADATSAINIVLSGGAVPSTHSAPSALTMAPYAKELSDEQVTQVVNFIQTSWGNAGGTTTPKKVAELRKIAIPVIASQRAISFAAGRGTAMTSSRTSSKLPSVTSRQTLSPTTNRVSIAVISVPLFTARTGPANQPRNITLSQGEIP